MLLLKRIGQHTDLAVVMIMLYGTTYLLPDVLLRIAVGCSHREQDHFQPRCRLEKLLYNARSMPRCPIPEQQNQVVGYAARISSRCVLVATAFITVLRVTIS